MNFWDLKTRYQRLCSAIKELAANVKITPRFLHMSLACQYDANVKMVDDFQRTGKTYDKIPADQVRPGMSLEVLKPPRSSELPPPLDDVGDAPTDVEPFMSGRFGERGRNTVTEEYAKQRRMVRRLPVVGEHGRLLTLYEVEMHHRRLHQPLGAKVRAVHKRTATVSTGMPAGSVGVPADPPEATASAARSSAEPTAAPADPVVVKQEASEEPA